MTENFGLLAAAGAALAWGTFMVPFKIAKSNNLILYQGVISIGVLLSGFILSLILGYSLTLNIYGIIAGVLWAIANAVALRAVVNLGLCKAVPLVSSLVVVSSFLWGALVFGEMPSGIITGSIAIVLIILGVLLVSTTSNDQGQNFKKGAVAGIVAGLIFGSQLVPLKVVNLETKDFFFSISLGVFITAVIIAIVGKIKFSRGAVKEGLLSGVIWNIGNLLSLLSLSLIGLAKMGPISQSSTLIAVFWGLFYFKEITQTKAKLQVLIGAMVLLFGVVVLGLA